MNKQIDRRYNWYNYLCIKCAHKTCRSWCKADEERGFKTDCPNLNKKTDTCYCVEVISEPKPGQKCIKFKEIK